MALESKPNTPRKPAWTLLDADQHLQTLDPDYAPTGLLDMVSDKVRSVLDVGCFCGGSGRYLKSRRPGLSVTGIEIMEKAAEVAAASYDRVVVGALESVDLSSLGRFDAIIVADVLEHLVNPWRALLRLKDVLSPGGQIFASIPNARHLRVVENLASGRWPHEGAGINDVSHLRFFTRVEIFAMFAETGWRIEDFQGTLDPQLADSYKNMGTSKLTRIETPRMILKDLTHDDVMEFMTWQFLVRASSF